METLQDLVTEGARRFAPRPALMMRPSFRTRTLRYRDLGATVPRVATVLSEAGVEPGQRVIVWAVNRPEWGLALLALAHLGAVAVPLDVRHTVAFGRSVAGKTDARLVLASRQTDASAVELGLPVLWIESLPDLARRVAPIAPAPIAGDTLAEIVFTSGTTGDPKGAMLTHANLLGCATAMGSVMRVAPDDRFLSVLPLSHLYEQVLGLIGPLLQGASVVYPVSRQPAVLLRTFRDFRVSILLIVPQGLRLLDAAIERKVDQAGRRARFEQLHAIARRLPFRARRLLFGPVLRELGGRLHTVGVGASALEVEIAQRWTEMGIRVLQGYGQTEMGPVVSFTRPQRNVIGTVGEPIPGVEVTIAADGEILARGPGQFAGYWQNPAATAAAMDDEGWYHTGDLGTLSADGLLSFRGRKKDMIALPDGQKVYPEDVETALRLDERIRDATVVAWPPGPNLRVHAVLLMDDPAEVDAVVRAANERLAPHQHIRGSTVWPDPDLPRTHTLKVRKPEVLARLEVMRTGEAAAPVAVGAASAGDVVPADPVTTIVAAIAGRSPGAIGPGDRLSSDLDLDSLRRVELLGVIEEELGVFVDDDALPPDATVGELVTLVEANREARRRVGSWTWPLSPVVRGVGLAFQVLLMQPFVRATYRVRTTGLEHLQGLDGPVLLTPNHCLHLDNAIILSRLPLAVRWHLSMAAAADTIYDNPIQGAAASVIANAFPLQREGGVRRSLELLGQRLDRGFSIVLFPEGKLTLGGPVQPFMAGAGLVAVEGGTPVIPVMIRINRMSVVDRRTLPGPLRGDVELVLGHPVVFDADTDHATATTRLEAALAAL